MVVMAVPGVWGFPLALCPALVGYVQTLKGILHLSGMGLLNTLLNKSCFESQELFSFCVTFFERGQPD